MHLVLHLPHYVLLSCLQCSLFTLTTTNSVGRKSASGLQWIGFGLKLSSCTGQVNHSYLARKPEKKKANKHVKKNAPMKPSHVCEERRAAGGGGGGR